MEDGVSSSSKIIMSSYLFRYLYNHVWSSTVFKMSSSPAVVGVVSYGFGCATSGFAGKHILDSLTYHYQQSYQFFLLNSHRPNLAKNSVLYSGVYARVTNYMDWIQSNIAVRILGAWGKNLRLKDWYTPDHKKFEPKNFQIK